MKIKDWRYICKRANVVFGTYKEKATFLFLSTARAGEQ